MASSSLLPEINHFTLDEMDLSAEPKKFTQKVNLFTLARNSIVLIRYPDMNTNSISLVSNILD